MIAFAPISSSLAFPCFLSVLSEYFSFICKEILNVDGVDAFIIGPYDLSCSMGIPGEFDNSEFIQTINEIIQIGSELDAVSGLHVVEPDIQKLNNAIVAGYKFIAYSVDIRMLDVTAREGMAEFKRLKK